jgi:hypothetical protein
MSENEEDLLYGAVVRLNPHDLDEAREEATEALVKMLMVETDSDVGAHQEAGESEQDAFVHALAENTRVIIEAAFMIGVAYQEMRQKHSYGADRGS